MGRGKGTIPSCNAKQSKAKQRKAKQCNATQRNAKQSNAKQMQRQRQRYRQSKPMQSNAMQIKAMQSKAMQSTEVTCGISTSSSTTKTYKDIYISRSNFSKDLFYISIYLSCLVLFDARDHAHIVATPVESEAIDRYSLWMLRGTCGYK